MDVSSLSEITEREGRVGGRRGGRGRGTRKRESGEREGRGRKEREEKRGGRQSEGGREEKREEEREDNHRVFTW